MSVKGLVTKGILALAVMGLVLLPFYGVSAQEQSKASIISEHLAGEHPFHELEASAPTIPKPEWYTNVTIYYSVLQNGAINSDFNEFVSQAHATLNDSRGWSRLGARFVRVESGGSFRLILSQASLVPSYSSGCSSDWSCNVGNNVIINDDRWAGASAAWNANGGSLRDYRHMVVNHETGHWLGHGHEFCSGAGNKAPVMQQQSIDLQGCTFNPWPLESELWTTRF